MSKHFYLCHPLVLSSPTFGVTLLETGKIAVSWKIPLPSSFIILYFVRTGWTCRELVHSSCKTVVLHVGWNQQNALPAYAPTWHEIFKGPTRYFWHCISEKPQICEYADDILVITRSLPALEALCVELSREAGRVGLVVSPDKTKYMRFSASPSRRSVKGIAINGVNYEGVAEFMYLWTLISNDNSLEKEIQKLFWLAIELILPL